MLKLRIAFVAAAGLILTGCSSDEPRPSLVAPDDLKRSLDVEAPPLRAMQAGTIETFARPASIKFKERKQRALTKQAEDARLRPTNANPAISPAKLEKFLGTSGVRLTAEQRVVLRSLAAPSPEARLALLRTLPLTKSTAAVGDAEVVSFFYRGRTLARFHKRRADHAVNPVGLSATPSAAPMPFTTTVESGSPGLHVSSPQVSLLPVALSWSLATSIDDDTTAATAEQLEESIALSEALAQESDAIAEQVMMEQQEYEDWLNGGGWAVAPRDPQLHQGGIRMLPVSASLGSPSATAENCLEKFVSAFGSVVSAGQWLRGSAASMRTHWTTVFALGSSSGAMLWSAAAVHAVPIIGAALVVGGVYLSYLSYKCYRDQRGGGTLVLNPLGTSLEPSFQMRSAALNQRPLFPPAPGAVRQPIGCILPS